MNFKETEAYLLSLGNEVSAMKLGLENIRKLLAALGDPQTKYLKVQVAGTNGKGSVCAFLNSICLQAGIKTGMYTSPHLVSMTERVKIDGVDLSEEQFSELATRVREVSESMAAAGEIQSIPTYFEQLTAIALVAFAKAKVELAILETGLGGRLDATTAANAEIAAITRIDYDHQQYLGDTIEEIAAEKAAIIHEGSRAVILRQSRAVEKVIAGRCLEVGVDATWSTGDVLVKRDRDVLPTLIATFTTDRASYGNILLWDMLGEHQIENAALAIGVAEILKASGLPVDSNAISTGLETAKHPGRLEFIGQFLLDGAHNIGGATALRSFLDEFIPKPITMVFGSMDDKDVAETGAILFPIAENLILTRPDNTRAISAEAILADIPDEIDRPNVVLTDSVDAAIAKAQDVTSADGVIVVTGSLYLVGEVKRILSDKLKTKN